VSQLQNVTLVLWLFAPALQVCLIILLLRREAHHIFRWFFAYNVFAVVAEITKMLLLHKPAAYFYFYFAAEACYAALGFLAIYEVFRYLFQSFYQLAWFKFLLPVTGIVMLGFSVLIPIARPPVKTDFALAALLCTEIAVRCLQVGVFFLIFLIARIFNMYYRQYAFGIAAGFGFSAIGILLSVMFRSGFGTRYKEVLTLVPSLAYDCAVAVWILSFIRQEAADPFRDFRHLFTPELFLQHLGRYREQIKGIMRL
jgi:hypothetical protein